MLVINWPAVETRRLDFWVWSWVWPKGLSKSIQAQGNLWRKKILMKSWLTATWKNIVCLKIWYCKIPWITIPCSNTSTSLSSIHWLNPCFLIVKSPFWLVKSYWNDEIFHNIPTFWSFHPHKYPAFPYRKNTAWTMWTYPNCYTFAPSRSNTWAHWSLPRSCASCNKLCPPALRVPHGSERWTFTALVKEIDMAGLILVYRYNESWLILILILILIYHIDI